MDQVSHSNLLSVVDNKFVVTKTSNLLLETKTTTEIIETRLLNLLDYGFFVLNDWSEGYFNTIWKVDRFIVIWTSSSDTMHRLVRGIKFFNIFWLSKLLGFSEGNLAEEEQIRI